MVLNYLTPKLSWKILHCLWQNCTKRLRRQTGEIDNTKQLVQCEQPGLSELAEHGAKRIRLKSQCLQSLWEQKEQTSEDSAAKL